MSAEADATLAPIAPRLKQLVLMLSSNQDGEVVAAARAIGKTLRSANADWHVFADALATPPLARPKQPRQSSSASWARVADPAGFLDRINAEPWLSPWESEFVRSIRGQLGGFMPRNLSEKQRAVLDRLVRRAAEHGVAI